MHWTARLYDHARAHRGVFAVRWAPLIGTTPKAVLAKGTRERWPQPYRGVLVVPGAPWDHLTDLTAAQAAVHVPAAARGQSAAFLYGLVPRAPARPQLLLPHAHQTELPVGLTRRSRHVGPQDRTTLDGIVVLTPTFWLISMARDTDDEQLFGHALDARQRRLLDPGAVGTRLESMPRVAGRRRLERVLRRLAHDGSDSVFESRVRERLLAAGLCPSPAPVPVPTTGGRTVHLDIAFPAERVAVECVGFEAHGSRMQLDRDARRENAIALTGDWLVLKLTWDRWLHDWDGFLAELLTALTARATR